MHKNPSPAARRRARNHLGAGVNALGRQIAGVEWLEQRLLLSAAPASSELSQVKLAPIAIRALSTGADGSSPVGNGYNPAQVRAAYGVDQLPYDGAGQTIAIVDAYDDPAFVSSTAAGFATSDLAEFDAAFGLANPPSFEKIGQTGSATGLPTVDPNDSWETEESLDVEWAHSIAPQANIVLVEANSSSGADLDAAVQLAASLPGVSAVSMSFGGDEYSGEDNYDSVFTTPAGHQGVTFLAATGDHGPNASYPAESPNVVAVGGTSLTLGSGGNSYGSETAWGGTSGIGTGGGPSAYEPEPSYQELYQSSGVRETADVAFLADPNTGVAVYDSYDSTQDNGPWVQVGGTSLATPCWAGLIALTNQDRVEGGAATLDGPSQTLPGLYSLPNADFHDITTGSSSNASGTLSAGVGYDEVTGRGTPVANLLVPDLAASNGGPTVGPLVFGPSVASVSLGGTLDFEGSNAITVADSTAAVTEATTLSVTAGELYLDASGVTVTAGALGSTTVTISGTLTEVNAALATLVYTAPTRGASTTLSVTDSNGTQTSNTLAVLIALKDAPLLIGPAAANVVLDESYAFSSPNAITVVDDTGVTSETVSLSVLRGLIAIDASGVSILSGANDSRTLTINGTIDAINAALATLVYTAPSQGVSDTLSVVDNDGLASSNTLNIAITLIGEPLLIASPTTLSVAHAGQLAFNTGANAISVSDAGGNTEAITLAVTSGELKLNASLVTISGGANQSGEITISGSLVAINSTLASLVYTAPDAGDSATLTITGYNGFVPSNTQIIAIALTDAPPVVAGPSSQSVAQRGSLKFSGANAITVSDVDIGSGRESVALGVDFGALTLNASGVKIVSGSSGSSALTISGTLAELNAALATLVYSAPTNGLSTTLTVSADDGTLSSAYFSVAITLLDAAPAVAGPATASVARAGQLDLDGADAITVSDADGGSSAESVVVSASAGVLALSAAGVTIIGGASGSSAVTISGTLAELNAALATLTYTAPNTGAFAVVSATANDGTLASRTLVIGITLTKAAPTLTGPASASVAHGGALNLGATPITVNDAEAGSDTLSVSISVGAGALTLTPSGATVSSGANGSSAIGLSGTLTQVNAALATLVYTAPLSGSSTTLTVAVSDGLILGDTSITAIALSDAAPALAGPKTASVPHSGQLALSGANSISVSDVDGGSAESVALSVTSGALVLTVGGATVESGASGTSAVKLGGTLDQLNAALATLVYAAPASGASATLTVTANDGKLGGKPLTTTITLTDLAPVLTGPATAQVSHGGKLVFSGASALAVADADANANGAESVALSVSGGTLSIASGGATVSGGASGSGAVKIEGTLAQLNAALATLVYTAPASGASATLTAIANDGQLNSASLVVAIALADVAPTVTGPATLSVAHGAKLALSGADALAVADVDAGGGAESVALGVTSGSLAIDASGATIVSGASGSGNMTLSGTLAELNAALATLVYTAPGSGASATLNAIANDGTLNSDTLTTTIALTDVAPVVTGPAKASVAHGGQLALSGASAIAVADVDAGATGTESVALGVTAGTLTLVAGGSTITSGASGSSALTISGTLDEVNAALATLVYTAPDSGASAKLTATANDGTLSGASLSTAISLTNVAPVVRGPAAASVAQGAELALSGTSAIEVSDLDGGSAVELVSLSVSGGSLSLSTQGITVGAGASGSSSLTIEGTLSALNAALATLVYAAPESGASATLTTTANDEQLNSLPLTTTIALTQASASLNGPASAAVAPGGAFAFSGANGLSVNEMGGSSVSVALSVTAGSLALATSGVTVSQGFSGSDAVTISGSSTNVNAALATLVYSAPASGSSATLAATATVGAHSSQPLAVSIQLTSVSLSLSGPSLLVVPHGKTLAVSAVGTVQIATATSTGVDASGVIETVSLAAKSGALSVSLSGGATLSAGANDSSSLSISGTAKEIGAALASLAYTAPASGTSDTVSIAFRYGAASAKLTISIDLTPSSVWQNSSNPLDVNNDGVVTPLDALLLIQDLDANGGRELPTPTGTPTDYWSVLGDGAEEPIDALTVIEALTSMGVPLASPATAAATPTVESSAAGAISPSVASPSVATSTVANSPAGSTGSLASASLPSTTSGGGPGDSSAPPVAAPALATASAAGTTPATTLSAAVVSAFQGGSSATETATGPTSPSNPADEAAAVFDSATTTDGEATAAASEAVDRVVADSSFSLTEL